jgi:hypothetical protein
MTKKAMRRERKTSFIEAPKVFIGIGPIRPMGPIVLDLL